MTNHDLTNQLTSEIVSKDAPFGKDGRGAWLIRYGSRDFIVIAHPEQEATQFWMGSDGRSIPMPTTMQAATWVYPATWDGGRWQPDPWTPVGGGQGMNFQQAIAHFEAKAMQAPAEKVSWVDPE